MITGKLIFQPANGFPERALQRVHDDLVFSSLSNSRSIFCATGQEVKIRNISEWLNLKAVTYNQTIVKFVPQNCENTVLCAGCGMRSHPHYPVFIQALKFLKRIAAIWK